MKKIFLIGIAAVALLVIFALNVVNVKLPNDFTIKLDLDSSSSGAGRLYAANITFVDSKAIAGQQKYIFGDTDRVYTCEAVFIPSTKS